VALAFQDLGLLARLGDVGLFWHDLRISEPMSIWSVLLRLD
jgi:hypothetical protein